MNGNNPTSWWRSWKFALARFHKLLITSKMIPCRSFYFQNQRKDNDTNNKYCFLEFIKKTDARTPDHSNSGILLWEGFITLRTKILVLWRAKEPATLGTQRRSWAVYRVHLSWFFFLASWRTKDIMICWRIEISLWLLQFLEYAALLCVYIQATAISFFLECFFPL